MSYIAEDSPQGQGFAHPKVPVVPRLKSPAPEPRSLIWSLIWRSRNLWMDFKEFVDLPNGYKSLCVCTLSGGKDPWVPSDSQIPQRWQLRELLFLSFPITRMFPPPLFCFLIPCLLPSLKTYLALLCKCVWMSRVTVCPEIFGTCQTQLLITSLSLLNVSVLIWMASCKVTSHM